MAVSLALAGALGGAVGAPPDGLQQSLFRAFRLHTEFEMVVPRDPDLLDRCLALLAPWREKAWVDEHAVFDYPIAWAFCHFNRQRLRGEAFTAADVLAAMQPWSQQMEAVGAHSAQQRLAKMLWIPRVLQSVGLGRDGTTVLLSAVHDAIDRQQGSDARAEKELMQLGQGVYGAFLMQAEVRAVQGIIEARLGPTHPSNLLMLRALAYHERYLGRPAAGMRYSERAVLLVREHHADKKLLKAQIEAVHASCLAAVGRLAEARDLALAVRDAYAGMVPLPHDRLTRIHYNLAGFALEMGDHESAIEHATRSLSHAGPAGLFYEARMPRAIAALAQLQRGDADAAKWLLAELQSAIQEEMHFGSLAMSLTSHAARLGDAALLRDAAVATQEHLRLFSAPLQVNTALRPLIQAWLTAGWSLRDPGVRPRLEQALAIALSGRSAGVQALTEFSLARHQAAADPDLALWLYKRAANRLQSLRAGLPDGDPGLHRSWLSQHEGDLRDFVALLIERGRLPEAEQALRLLREEELFDYVRRRAPGGAGTALSFTATEVLRNEALAPVEQAAEQAAVAAAARVDARGVNALRGDYVDPLADADLERLTQSVHERLAAAPVANRGSLPRAETALRPPAGVARLSYLVREKGLDILVRTSAGHWRARVPLAPGELNRAIFAARAATSTAQRDALPALQHLWRILLAPVAFHLRGQRELRVQPDAALRYVPFAALHDGRRFLVEHYVLSTEAVAAPVGPMVARSELSIVAFGRTTGDAQHSALPGVAQELAALRQHGAEVHAEQAFSAKSLEAALRRHPDIVHVASHFRLDPGSDEASYLLLGDGSNLSVAQLAKLPWAGVRLALLSACDSATAPSQGREWLGLASALQRAGVSQVLATLWRVADESTAEWVQAFYALPQRGSGLLQARRLAEVQRDWLRRHRGDAQGHPHYWAAFTWLGGS